MNIFSTEGRIGRLGYFLWVLALIVVASVVMAIFSIDADSGAYVFVGIPLAILSVFPAVRRLHDLNKSGWLFLLSFIPLVNFGLGLYLLFGKGGDCANQYGAPPPNLLDKMTIKSPDPRTPFDIQASDSSLHQKNDTVSYERTDDDAFYEKAYVEFESERLDKALWAKLFAQTNGDEKRAKAKYIQLRTKELMDEAEKERRLAQEKELELQKQAEARAQRQRQEKQKKDRIFKLTHSLESLLKQKRCVDARTVAEALRSLDPDNVFVLEQMKTLPHLAWIEQAHNDTRRVISNLKPNGVSSFLIKRWETEIARVLNSLSDNFRIVGADADKYREEIEELRLSGIQKIKRKRRNAAIALLLTAVVTIAAILGHSAFKKRQIERLTTEFHQAVSSRDYSKASNLSQMLVNLNAPGARSVRLIRYFRKWYSIHL